MEDNNTGIDPEAEVKKLQDLVKKLEQQNQILRNKQNEVKTGSVISKEKIAENGDVRIKTTFKNTQGNDNDYVNNISLDEVALVDVDNVTCEEEDNW